MTRSKSLKGKQKIKPRAGRTPSGKKRRNWTRIRQAWYQSELTLLSFLRSQGIPKATGLAHLSAKDKEEYLQDHEEAADKFRKRLAKIAAKDDSRLYIASLKHVSAATQEILLDAAQGFKSAPVGLSKRDAGRLVIAAGDQLIRVTSELQGIPDEDEVDGWPLSRCFQPFRYQRDFLFDTPKTIQLEEHLPEDGSQDPFVLAFVGGRGAGKTFIGAQKAGQLAWLNRGLNGCVLAPTYPKLRDAAKAAFLKACSDKGLSFKHLKTENAVILFGDTKVYFRSMDDPDSVRGLNLAWAWPDELGQLPTREAFDVLNGCIRGRDIPEPAIIVTTTPDGLNWLYDVLVTGADQNRARVYRARTKENPVLGDFERRLRASYDPRFAAQELDAEWIDIFSGKAYWNFSTSDNVLEDDAFEPHAGLPLDLCCDFNVAPMCWNLSQDLKINGDTWTYVFDEIHLDTAGTDLTVKELLERYGEHRAGFRVYGDATGQARATSATRSDYQIIEDALTAEELPVELFIGRSNPRQRDRVLSVNARLLAADGSRRLFISKRCKHTIIDFQRTRFVPGTQQLDKGQSRATQAGGKTKKALLTHHTDAVGYKVFRMWPVRKAVVSQPQTRH